MLALLRPHFAKTNETSTGILTGFPSTTLFSLVLGPDLPWEDEPSPGNLWLSAGWFLTILIVTHASILTLVRSICPHGHTSMHTKRSSTTSEISQDFIDP